MAGELVKVPFYGDELEATLSGECVKVSIRRCCENLDIDFGRQLRKLRSVSWAVVDEMSTTGSDGKQYTMVMIDLESLPIWLVSIHPNKVKEHVREKLARYQKEAKKVLADHFLRKSPNTVTLPKDLFEQLAKLPGHVEFLQKQVDALRAGPPAMIAPAVPRFTVRQRLEWKGWVNAPKKARKNIQKMAATLIDQFCQEPVMQAGGTGGGGPTYFAGVHLTYLDEAIDRIRDNITRAGKAAGPDLFTPDRPAA